MWQCQTYKPLMNPFCVGDKEWGLRVDEERSWSHPELAKDVTLNPILERAIIGLSFTLIVLYVALCAGLGYNAGLLDLAMAPFGALLRWYLSLRNASWQKACFGIPVFTLIANTIGVACNAFPTILAARVEDPLGKLALAAISTGFAGCLSTVSTLISELRSDAIGGLRVRVVYFLLSFGLAMAIECPLLTAQC
mmetsp:Transcript_147230/g.470602  ORF Transcript_147230/g.470602 Transcript_147230/m.470602 type:complete len:194 (+) Transcript_147230:3-584(+)